MSEITTNNTPNNKSIDEASVILIRDKLGVLLSKENLLQSKFLLIHMDAQCFVPITTLLSDDSMKDVNTSVEDVVAACNGFSKFVLNIGKTGLKANLKAERTTLIIRQIPAEIGETDIIKLFDDSNCGTVVKAWSDVGSTWFVSFSSETDAVEALKHLRSQKLNGEPIRARLKSENPFRDIILKKSAIAPATSMTMASSTNVSDANLTGGGGGVGSSSTIGTGVFGGANTIPYGGMTIPQGGYYNSTGFNQGGFFDANAYSNMSGFPSYDEVSGGYYASMSGGAMPMNNNNNNNNNSSKKGGYPRGNNRGGNYNKKHNNNGNNNGNNSNNYNRGGSSNNNNNNKRMHNSNKKNYNRKNGGPSNMKTVNPLPMVLPSVPIFGNNELFPPLPGNIPSETGSVKSLTKYSTSDILFIVKKQTDLSLPVSMRKVEGSSGVVTSKPNTHLIHGQRTESMESAIAHGRPVRSLTVSSADYELMMFGGSSNAGSCASSVSSYSMLKEERRDEMGELVDEFGYAMPPTTVAATIGVTSEKYIAPISSSLSPVKDSSAHQTSKQSKVSTTPAMGGYAAALLKKKDISAPSHTNPVATSKSSNSSSKTSSASSSGANVASKGGRKAPSKNSTTLTNNSKRNGKSSSASGTSTPADSVKGVSRKVNSKNTSGNSTTTATSTSKRVILTSTPSAKSGSISGGNRRGWEQPREKRPVAPPLNTGNTTTSSSAPESSKTAKASISSKSTAASESTPLKDTTSSTSNTKTLANSSSANKSEANTVVANSGSSTSKKKQSTPSTSVWGMKKKSFLEVVASGDRS